MKKLLSLVLTLALALSLSVTAFAEGDEDTGTTTQDTTINYGDNDQTGSTTVNYSVTPAYTVTIPEKVTVGGEAVKVKVSGVKVTYGKQVVVRLTGINVTPENPSGDTGFKVKTKEGAELTYSVKKQSGSIITADGSNTVLTVNPLYNSGASVSLIFALAEPVQYAGDYSGTVTFTVSVEDVPANSGTTGETP